MKVLFQNHSSLLIQYGDRYLLTDPWYDRPAFGSWLPSLAPYIHPTYLAGLGERLSILVSHGHGDHFDDRLLTIFDKHIKIITGDFKSSSVTKRVKRLGFENIISIGEEERLVDDLLISTYVVDNVSHDDATYLIRNSDGAVIHTNDNWHKFETAHEALIKDRTKDYERSSILLFSQTNSASGFPLNYRNFNEAEKQDILKEKIVKMVCGGLSNAEALGLSKIYSYAGFASAYVKGKNYDAQGVFPTAQYLSNLLKEHSVEREITIPDLYPGDSINLPSGEISKAFITGYEDSTIRNVTDEFYNVYGHKEACISYRDLDITMSRLENWIEFFLTEFNAFAVKRVNGLDSHYVDLIGKEFTFDVSMPGVTNICKTIRFGDGLVRLNEKANKVCHVDGATLQAILKGEALFEYLYTGYNAEWSRYPADVYNRDIVMMIVMFSYVYKNQISESAKDRFL